MAFADDLRARLIDPAAALELDVQGQVQAAVLVPLYVADGAVHAVFTKRGEDMRRHAGEISFPGGRRDHAGESLLATALREACEEIGLEGDAVEVIGALAPTSTVVTGFGVHPFVGIIASDHVWTLSPREVEHVLEFSLSDLAAGYARRTVKRRGLTVRVDTYTVGEHTIWGATARMVCDLLERAGVPAGAATQAGGPAA